MAALTLWMEAESTNCQIVGVGDGVTYQCSDAVQMMAKWDEVVELVFGAVLSDID